MAEFPQRRTWKKIANEQKKELSKREESVIVKSKSLAKLFHLPGKASDFSTSSAQEDEDDEQEEELTEEDKATQKAKKVRWITRLMADDFSRQIVLYATFKEATIYIIFVVAIIMCTIARRDDTLFYFTKAIKGQFIDKNFRAHRDIQISFQGIKTTADFWFYLEGLLLDSLYWEHYYSDNDPVRESYPDEQKVLYQNYLLGVPRIRQVKVRNDSCVVHEYFRKITPQCYDIWDSSIDDRRSFGPGNGTAWTYSPESKTIARGYEGFISSYDGGGYYQDLGRTKNETGKIIAYLKKNLWVTRGTRAIFLDFSLYNANINVFVVCKLVFEFPPTGGILPDHHLQAIKLLEFGDSIYYVTLSFEYMVYCMAVLFIIEAAREIVYLKFRYFCNFWPYIDVVLIVLAGANFFTSIVIFPNAEKHVQNLIKNPHKYGNLEFQAHAKILYNEFAASLVFFAHMKFFKYLNFNKMMGQLNTTLKNCLWDIVGFSLMFFIIFIAYAELGYLLFGPYVDDFKSFGFSMLTLFKIILGDFDYEKIRVVNSIAAPMFFTTFIVLVFFVLFNMFLAIINDTFSDVKTEIAIAPDEMNMSEYVKRGLYKLMRKLGFKVKQHPRKTEVNVTVQQVREALKKCGFTDLEIQVFFARYNIDPHEDVGERDPKKIAKQLEALQLENENEDTVTLINFSDFIQQQEKLDQIEHAVVDLSKMIKSLLRKLDIFERLYKSRAY